MRVPKVSAVASWNAPGHQSTAANVYRICSDIGSDGAEFKVKD
jgi:hypothetical protein